MTALLLVVGGVFLLTAAKAQQSQAQAGATENPITDLINAFFPPLSPAQQPAVPVGTESVSQTQSQESQEMPGLLDGLLGGGSTPESSGAAEPDVTVQAIQQLFAEGIETYEAMVEAKEEFAEALSQYKEDLAKIVTGGYVDFMIAAGDPLWKVRNYILDKVAPPPANFVKSATRTAPPPETKYQGLSPALDAALVARYAEFGKPIEGSL